MNISTRLMLGLGFVVALLLLLGTAGQVALASLGSAVDALLKQDYSAVEAVGEMARATDKQDAAAFANVLGDTTGYSAKREAAAAEQYSKARALADKAVAEAADQREALARVDEAKRRYDESLARLRATSRGPDAVNAYYGMAEPEYLKLAAAISDLGSRAQARGSDAGADALRVAWRTRAWAGVITAFVFAALIWTATHLYRTIVWPLSEMARTARAMMHGEANRRFRAGARDELGELAELLNSLADRLFAKEREADQRDAAHEQILESVLDRWTDGLAVVDTTGRVVAANAAFRQVQRASERQGRGHDVTLNEHPHAQREKLVFRGRREFGELVRLAPPRPTLPDTSGDADKPDP